MTYGPQPAAPVLVAFEGPTKQRRLTVFFRLLLALPQLIVLGIVGIAVYIVLIISWFGALFMGRLPRFAADFLPGFLRWQVRVGAYVVMLTDIYPPFTLESDDAYPVSLTAQPGRLNRGAVFFRLILAFPAYVYGTVTVFGAFTLVGVITWFIVLITGRMPPSLHLAYAAVVRYQIRASAYLFMITSEWPWGMFGDTDVLGAHGPAAAFGAPGATGTLAYGATTEQPFAPAPPFGQPQPFTQPQPFAQPVAQPVAQPQPFAPTPATPASPASARPTLPGVDFTFGGPSYLWGYTADRSHCGIWSTTNPGAPPQTWPIGEQGEAWSRFWVLEPQALEFTEPAPPPTLSPPGVAPSSGPPASLYAAPSFPPSGLPPEAGVWPTEVSRWRLVLSSGARKLIVFFIVLGSVLYIAVNVIQFTVQHPLQKLEASIEVQSAYASLTTAVTTYETNTNACGTSPQGLTCVTGADRTVGQAFGVFVSKLSAISEPAGAVASASALASDGTHAQQVFEQLAASTTVAQYQQNVQSSNLTQVLTQFSQDYQHLVNQLG